VISRTHIVGFLRAQHGSILGIAALVCLALISNRFSNIDLIISGWFYDAAAQRFPLRNEWLWSMLLHEGEKWLAVGMVIALIVVWGFSFRGSARNQAFRAAVRSFAAFTIVVALLAAGVVAFVKGQSAHSCPWHLALFGGTADFFRIGDPFPLHPGSGRCLPSGHASVAFMWIAAVYASRRWLPQYAKRLIAIVLILALVAGYVQIARGAHFLSHILLSAALCWAIAWMADVVYSARMQSVGVCWRGTLRPHGVRLPD
jgi:PAP2 (acid phosphatase) superfamily protein